MNQIEGVHDSKLDGNEEESGKSSSNGSHHPKDTENEPLHIAWLRHPLRSQHGRVVGEGLHEDGLEEEEAGEEVLDADANMELQGVKEGSHPVPLHASQVGIFEWKLAMLQSL